MMTYNWDNMVEITVPKGTNGWVYSGEVTINGVKVRFPVGTPTTVPEPAAALLNKMIELEREDDLSGAKPNNHYVGNVTVPDGKTLTLQKGAKVVDEAGVLGGSSAPAEVVILPETTVGITNMQGYLTTPCSELPKPGSTIAAIYNGVRYECKLGVMYSGDGDGLALGNLGAVETAGGNNDAPFVIVFIPDGMDTDGDGNIDIYGIVMALDGSSEVTISLVKVADPAPGETFRVNVLVQEGEVVSCDSNIGEIKMAFDSGKMPYCVVDEHHGTKSIFSLLDIGASGACFVNGFGSIIHILNFDIDGTITYGT